MKTIEKAAKDYRIEKGSLYSNIGLLAEDAFKAGVNFAQKWISADDEIPPVNLRILVKSNTGYIETRTIKKHQINGFKLNVSLSGNNVTHWKYIDLK